MPTGRGGGSYFHSDFVDVLGLMCLCKGRSGGLNQFVSSLAVHNVILATRPELLEPLCRGFHYHRLGEEGPGEAPITPCRVPVFSVADGRLSARYSRTYLGEGVRAHGELSPFEAEALAYFDEVCLRLDLVAELGLEPGEGVFINNFTILHGRDAFEDGPDPARKRHLLRVWLAVGRRPPPGPGDPGLRRRPARRHPGAGRRPDAELRAPSGARRDNHATARLKACASFFD